MPVVRVLEDGTRVYATGNRYKPVAPENRIYKRHVPDVEGAFRVAGTWYLPLPLIPDEARSWPDTRGMDPTRTKRARRKDLRSAKTQSR